MGTICILLGLIILLCSIGLGCVGANLYLASSFPVALTALPSDPVQVYAICIGICGFIGLLMCLNLVMHGLTYNKVKKLLRRKSR